MLKATLNVGMNPDLYAVFEPVRLLYSSRYEVSVVLLLSTLSQHPLLAQWSLVDNPGQIWTSS